MSVVITDLFLDLLPCRCIPALVELVLDSALADLKEEIDPEKQDDL